MREVGDGYTLGKQNWLTVEERQMDQSSKLMGYLVR